MFLWGDQDQDQLGSVVQDLSGSWCIKRTGESMARVDSLVPWMHHDPDRSWITDPDPDHPKGTHPYKIHHSEKMNPWIPLLLTAVLAARFFN